ncbi:MAG: hypothetical protein JWQ79_2615 [Mucilaginibacter sp.]|nr:hypothetical protein [Mucilaginibacter sp.]
MKKIHINLIAVLTVQLTGAAICNAQTTVNLKPAPANIVIDGNISEWGDSLAYYNNQLQANYMFTNDKDNLYLAIKTNDPVEEAKILSSGVTLSIDTKGKKKSDFSVTFPVPELGNQTFNAAGTAQEKDLAAGLTKFRKIKADGFKDVEYDLVTLQNTYGFKMAISFDEHGAMIYEEAIPLALFHADGLKNSEWMFNIKINGQEKIAKKEADGQDQSSSMGGGRGGRGGGGGGGGGGGRGGAGGGGGGGGGRGGRGGQRAGADTNAGDSDGGLSKSIDFWGKFVLAK